MVHIPTQEVPISNFKEADLIAMNFRHFGKWLISHSFLAGPCCAAHISSAKEEHHTAPGCSIGWQERGLQQLGMLAAIWNWMQSHHGETGRAVWAIGKGWGAIRWQWCSENWERVYLLIVHTVLHCDSCLFLGVAMRSDLWDPMPRRNTSAWQVPMLVPLWRLQDSRLADLLLEPGHWDAHHWQPHTVEAFISLKFT